MSTRDVGKEFYSQYAVGRPFIDKEHGREKMTTGEDEYFQRSNEGVHNGCV